MQSVRERERESDGADEFSLFGGELPTHTHTPRKNLCID